LFTLYRAEFGKLVSVGGRCAVVFVAVAEIRIAGFLAGLLAGMIAATVAVVTQKAQLPVNEDT
jgi:fructose-specific phosphotransferase system IIC component